MSSDATATLGEVFAEVLMAQTFLFAEECSREEVGEVIAAASYLRGAISFEGPTTGVLEMAVPVAVAAEAGANMLGLDEAEAGNCAEDAFGELANVVCGQLLTTLYGADQVFSLSLPTVSPARQEEIDSLLGDPDCIAFTIDAAAVLVRLSLKER